MHLLTCCKLQQQIHTWNKWMCICGILTLCNPLQQANRLNKFWHGDMHWLIVIAYEKGNIEQFITCRYAEYWHSVIRCKTPKQWTKKTMWICRILTCRDMLQQTNIEQVIANAYAEHWLFMKCQHDLFMNNVNTTFYKMSTRPFMICQQNKPSTQSAAGGAFG